MTCTLVVNGGLTAYVDDEDAAMLRRYSWTRTPGANTWYAVTSIDGKLVLLHRLILNYYGEEDIDHRNGNGLDCRKSNMWVAGRTNNNLNKPATEGVKERFLSGGEARYDSRVQHLGMTYHLGTFNNYDTAYRLAALNRRRLLSGRRPIALKREHRWANLRRVQL